ncbi:MAG: tetratricopeptide repeat protein [bacterium]
MKKLRIGLLFSAVLMGITQKILLQRFSPEFEWRTGASLPAGFYRFVTLGNAGFASDLLVIQLTQYFVRPAHLRDELWEQKMLEVATDLDAHNWSAWVFAVTLMGFRENEIRSAIPILQKGIAQHPTDWRFPFWVSQKCYEIRDWDCAIMYAKKASEYADAPREIRSFPALLYLRMGHPALALAYLDVLIQKETDEKQKQVWMKRKQWLAGKMLLEKAVEIYRQKFGTIPTLQDLVKSGILKEIPEEPFERGWQIHPLTGEVSTQ